MAQTERVELGVFEGREYWLNLKTGNVEWRVPDIREAVHAPFGFKILSSDFSQIEIKIMAFLSGDPWLIEAINSGKDIHAYLATELFGEVLGFDYETMIAAKKDDKHPRHDELTKLRNDVKAVSFGIVYGAGPPRIAAMTNRSVPEAQDFINLYFSKARVLKLWLENQGRMATRDGFTTSPGGRKRFYVMPAIDDPKRDETISQIHRWAGNHPIQAGCTDMLKLSMRAIYKGFRQRGWKWSDARILFVVHDEIVCLCRTEYVDEAQKLMQESMTAAYNTYITGLKNEVKVVVGDLWLKD